MTEEDLEAAGVPEDIRVEVLKQVSHSHTLILSHSHTLRTLTLSHSHTPTLPHSHTLTLSHSHTLRDWHLRVPAPRDRAERHVPPRRISPDIREDHTVEYDPFIKSQLASRN